MIERPKYCCRIEWLEWKQVLNAQKILIKCFPKHRTCTQFKKIKRSTAAAANTTTTTTINNNNYNYNYNNNYANNANTRTYTTQKHFYIHEYTSTRADDYTENTLSPLQIFSSQTSHMYAYICVYACVNVCVCVRVLILRRRKRKRRVIALIYRIN